MDNTENFSTKVDLIELNIKQQGVTLNDPDTITKIPQEDLIALATEIQKADNFIKANACSKLQVIVEQIKALKKQAENVLVEADKNMKLHHVACNFIKQPGHVYHLYEKQTGELYFSMLSPEEWGNCGPSQIYRGSYRLEQDQSWTLLQDIDKKTEEMAILTKLWSNLPVTNSSSKKLI